MNNVDLWIKASRLRNTLGEDPKSPVDIFSLVHIIDNLTIVFFPMGKNVSGICIKGHSNSVIAVNSEMSVGRQHFSMAHELFHLYYDNNLARIICSSNIGAGRQIEKDADQFASYFLMPPDALNEKIDEIKNENTKLSIDDIVKIEQHFGVSRKALLVRLLAEKIINSKEAASIRKNIISSASKLGYDVSLYKPLPLGEQYMTYGYYIQQAEKVCEKELVSNGKYEELLLEAFRADLVYGFSVEGGELFD